MHPPPPPCGHRCHPVIANIANVSFYGNRLRHGCTAEQRAPLLPGLPPLMWLDVLGQEQGSSGRVAGSLCNPQEATATARLLRTIVQEGGVAPARCGVIACYRRQVSTIQQALGGGEEGNAAAVQVATVDSFQVCHTGVSTAMFSLRHPHIVAPLLWCLRLVSVYV